MNDEETPQPEKRIDTIYTAQFRKHLSKIQEHLNGRDSERLFPSFVHPTGFWTPDEKDMFFHALGIHSRLRPDLIAASIGTKTVLDVCTYIDFLEAALSEEPDAVVLRNDHDVSMEMSESWVTWEDNRAINLVASEAHWEQGVLEKQAKDAPSSSHPRDFNVQTTSLGVLATDHELWKSQEAILRSLDSDTLQVMERILNEAEGDLHRIPEASSQAPSRPQTPVISATEPTNTDDAMIADPIASPSLDTPAGTSGSTPSDLQEASSSRRTPSDHPDGDGEPDLSQLSPRSRRKFQKRLYMRRKRAAQSGAELNTAASKLKPGRKTKFLETAVTADSPAAGNHGVEDVPVSERNDTPEEPAKAKTGKRKKKKISQGGITKPYKIKNELLSKGVDRRLLADDDLCLFHLSTLGRLMGFYSAGYGKDSPHTASAISADTIQLFATIAADFVSDLIFHAINLQENQRRVKEGTLVYRLGEGDINAVSVERAKRLMGLQDRTVRNYFAKLLDESTVDHDDGSESETGKERGDGGDDDDYEEDEPDMGNTSPAEVARMAPSSRPSSSGPPKLRPSGVDQPLNYPKRLPTYRELNPPLVHLPKSLLPPTAGFPVAPLGYDTHDLLPELLDEDELARELQEEEELDSKDRKVALEYEVALWKEFCQDGGESMGEEADDSEGVNER